MKVTALTFALISLLGTRESVYGQQSAITYSPVLEYPFINGLHQAITIQGDTSKPLLLFLHGGPGRSLTSFASAFTTQLPVSFTVVLWDQRGTGETQKKNQSPKTITPKLIEQDALAIVRYLLQKHHRSKLYLVSHSWGAVPGFEIARQHPELLHAYVAISPVIDLNQSAKMTCQMLRSWADSTQNEAAAKELAEVHIPYKKEADMFTVQKWLFLHNDLAEAGSATFKESYYSWMKTWFPVWMASAKSNAFVTTPTLKCPFWLFEGRGDNQTPPVIAEHYFTKLRAPQKHLIWFEQSGHTIFNTEPQKVERLLIDSVARTTTDPNNK